MTLLQAIRERRAEITILGLGYVGLPLSVSLAEAGFPVIGYDSNADRIAALQLGENHVADVSQRRLSRVLARGKLRVTSEASELAAQTPQPAQAAGMAVPKVPAIFVICVPTPFNKARQPDLSFVVQAARTVASALRRGSLVVLESTTYPGTTREVVRPILEARTAARPRDLQAGRDFALAFAPERVDPGNARYHVDNTPRIVGGLTPRCTRLARAFYSQIAPQVRAVASLETAEMTKLMENTFRHVNIALVNEMAVLCTDLGVDVWEMIDAAATKPFGYMPFYPGPGVGGHCIPIDPGYLSYRVRELGGEARFVELAEAVNEHMPDYVVSRVGDALNERGRALRGARILVLGAAYKRNVADVRESPGLKVIAKLRQKGALVRYHDPLVPEVDGTGEVMRSVPLTPEEMERSDCVVVVTDHRALPYRELVRRCSLILDTRNALRRYRADNIVRL